MHYSRFLFFLSLGKCFTDDKWPECSGGCNDFETGSSCFEAAGGKCTAGDVGSMEIHCNTGIKHSLFFDWNWLLE